METGLALTSIWNIMGVGGKEKTRFCFEKPMSREEKIEEALNRGVKQILPSKKKLKKRLVEGESLRLYQGFDPSMPSLHLGNLVGVLKLAQFQEIGCEVVFLVGDFTGMIGDPTDKADTRPRLSREEVLENADHWKKQISGIIDFEGANKAKMKYNSEWLDKVTFRELIGITANFTVQQMLERDFFQKRIERERPIHLHEFLYPVAQGLDSVKMDVDLEIGGSDQLFNMLAGRTLMKKMKGKEKYVLTTKLLLDKRGRKVGKTTGNAVFLDMDPDRMYGAVMNFPDEVIVPGFKLLTRTEPDRIERIEKNLEKGQNPMKAKKKLAFEITGLVHGEQKAEKAEKEFKRVFEDKKRPTEIEEVEIEEERMRVAELLVRIKLCPSKNEAKRMVDQGAVRIGGERIKKWGKKIEVRDGMVVRVGKRKFRKLTHNP